MNKLDPNEEDSSGDELNKTTTQPLCSLNNQDSSSDTDNGEAKQKTSLDVCSLSKSIIILFWLYFKLLLISSSLIFFLVLK